MNKHFDNLKLHSGSRHMLGAFIGERIKSITALSAGLSVDAQNGIVKTSHFELMSQAGEKLLLSFSAVDLKLGIEVFLLEAEIARELRKWPDGPVLEMQDVSYLIHGFEAGRVQRIDVLSSQYQFELPDNDETIWVDDGVALHMENDTVLVVCEAEDMPTLGRVLAGDELEVADKLEHFKTRAYRWRSV